MSVYGLAKESLDGGLPNYQPTRLNGSGNFFFPPNKKVHIFSTFLFFYLNSSNHVLHSCILLGLFLVGKSYCLHTFNIAIFLVFEPQLNHRTPTEQEELNSQQDWHILGLAFRTLGDVLSLPQETVWEVDACLQKLPGFMV